MAIDTDYATCIKRTNGLTKMEIMNFAVFLKQSDSSMLRNQVSEVASAYSDKPRAHAWKKIDHDAKQDEGFNVRCIDVFRACCNGIDEYSRLKPDCYIAFDHRTQKINLCTIIRSI